MCITMKWPWWIGRIFNGSQQSWNRWCTIIQHFFQKWNNTIIITYWNEKIWPGNLNALTHKCNMGVKYYKWFTSLIEVANENNAIHALDNIIWFTRAASNDGRKLGSARPKMTPFRDSKNKFLDCNYNNHIWCHLNVLKH